MTVEELDEKIQKYITKFCPNGFSNDRYYIPRGVDYNKKELFFSDDLKIESLHHDELLHLSVTLTELYRCCLHNDHRIFWSWVALLVDKCGHFEINELHKFNGLSRGLKALTHLLLSEYNDNYQQASTLVNKHLLYVAEAKHLIAEALGFSILEGILKRINSQYVYDDGRIKEAFKIDYGKKTYSKTRINDIGVLLKLYEEKILDNSSIRDKFLRLAKSIESFPSHNERLYELISGWRNEFLHGEKIWREKIPFLMNVICFVLINHINTNDYNKKIDKISEVLNYQLKHSRCTDSYPPDLDYFYI